MIDREVVYERNITGSYMKITAAGCAKFDERMLFKKKVKGLLEAEQCFLNGCAWYWYNISGKQSLDTYCRIQNIGVAFIEKIIISICDEIEILEWNLFDLDCLVLDPEFIFIHNINQEIIFTVYPGHHEALSSQLQQLMEYLLTKIDHSDAEAVKVAYGIYEKTLDEAYGVMDIRDAILAERNKNVQKKEEKEITETKNFPPKELNNNMIEVDKKKKSLEKWKISGKKTENILNLAKSHIWGKTAETDTNTSETFAYIMQLLGNWREKILSTFSKRVSDEDSEPNTSFQKDSPMVVYPEEPYPMIQPAIHPTICLTDYADRPKGALLYEGTDEIEDIRLPQSDVNIGKAETAEIRIAKETISQYHAKVTYREKEYYLEDLNSTNGTYINEEALAYKEYRKLQVNDIVRFADIRFRFI